MKISLLEDRILLRPFSQEEQSSTSGIIISDSTDENPLSGVIIDVGGSIAEGKMSLKKGDIVLYGKDAGVAIMCMEAKYLVIHRSDILATL